MAENKKSFILYTDLITTVNKLPDDIAGKLFKIILEYVNDKNPDVDDLLLQVAFEPIRTQLKRDLVRWEEFRKKQSDNGKLGGRPNKPEVINKKPNNPSLISKSQKSLNATATVTVNATATSREKVVEFLRGAAPISIPMTEIEQQADLLMEQYEGKKIGNLRALCNSWAENMQNTVLMPKAKQQRVGRDIKDILNTYK